MNGLAQFDPTLPEWRAIFPARLTAVAQDEAGDNLYSWEEVVQDGDGSYTKAIPGRTGDAESDPRQNPARELNNASVTIPADEADQPIVWMRVRGVRGTGDVVYEFSAGLAEISGGTASFAVITEDLTAGYYAANLRTYNDTTNTWETGTETVIVTLPQSEPSQRLPVGYYCPVTEVGTRVMYGPPDNALHNYRLFVVLDTSVVYAAINPEASIWTYRPIKMLRFAAPATGSWETSEQFSVGVAEATATASGVVSIYDDQEFSGRKVFQDGIISLDAVTIPTLYIGNDSRYSNPYLRFNTYDATPYRGVRLTYGYGIYSIITFQGKADNADPQPSVEISAETVTLNGVYAGNSNYPLKSSIILTKDQNIEFTANSTSLNGATLPSGTISYQKPGGGGTGTITVSKGFITSWT